MKMIGEFFREEKIILDCKDVSNKHLHCTAMLVPEKECEVMKAHFPGRPVIPGACLLATVGELVCRMMQQQCHITQVKSIKFISLIEPDGEEPVSFDVDFDVATMKVQSTIMYKDSICCKMNLSCRTVS